MKRIETAIKSKGIKAHVPNNYHAHSFYKFDRYYVASKYGDMNHVSFSCGSRRTMHMLWYEHSNTRLWIYLHRYMHKRVGRKLDDVFHDFSCLGWKSALDMFHYWSGFIGSERCGYYADEDGYMCIKPSSKKHSYDWDDFDEYDEDDNEPYLLQYAQKPSSQKRFVRRISQQYHKVHTFS